MTIAEEFGKYLLLKKLKEDSIGETFRAGKAGKDSIEQVVLLRVFNGQGLNAEKLWQRVSDRGPVQQGLRSPNIGSGVDLGRVRTYPYAAYDYISGKDLSSLFAQAARLHSPIPTDHALVIAERLSLALAAAYETRVKDERILHGFVVPQLVVISNEGETRLLGFEVAPGLREVAAGGWMPAELQPYLSPETTSAPASKTDDVYSLGAIFFHLLTGAPLPPAPADGYGALIDGALLANEGTPLPAPIAGLLKKSLTSRDQRIPDAINWHKAISKLMIDGNYNSTTFNLAFFMHNLFRDDIERESQEIQSERTMELPRRASAVVAAPAAPPLSDTRDTGARERTLPGTAAAAPARQEGSKAGLWIGLAALLLAGLGAGWYFLGRTPPQPAQQAQATPPTAVPAAPAGPTPEEIQAQIQQIIEARSKEMQDKLRVQYDEQLKQLDRQLQDSRRASDAERLRAASEASRPAPAPAPAVAAPDPTPAQEVPRPAPARTEPAPAPSNPAPSNPAPAEQERPVVPAPAPQTQAPAPAPQRAQPRVQLGDLVQAGPDVVAPTRVSPLAPRYPLAARKFNKTATVSLRVLIDERGKVIQSEIIGERAGYGFDEAALDAARQVTFKPATKEGVRVKMWTTLRIAFKP